MDETRRRLESLEAERTRMPLALVRFDADLRIIEWNGAAQGLFGYSEEEALGRDPFAFLFPPDVPEHIGELLARVRAGDMDVRNVAENVTKTGERVLVEWFNTPYLDDEGRYAGHTAMGIDVTARTQAEAAFQEAMIRLKVVSRRVVDVQESERRHLARELHDEVGQVLSAIAINLHAIRASADASAHVRIDECLDAINMTIRQVRELSLDLRPVMLDALGLASTLRWLVDHMIVRAGITAHVDIVPSGDPIPGDLATACFRVAQEAMTNIIRHARATEVWVTMEQDDGHSVSVTVRDNGVGFDHETELARAGLGESLGLLGIRERVELFEGRLDVESAPGAGTSIRVWFPITAAD